MKSSSERQKEDKTMACPRCGGRIRDRTASLSRPYAFTISGLDAVFLCGIRVKSCAKCGLEAPTIPKLRQLNQLITDTLIAKKSRLRGDELRFIRSHAGCSSQKVAALLGVSPSHLSRAENGRTALGESVDRLARIIVGTATRSDAAREILLEYAQSLEEANRSERPYFTFERKWRAAA